MEESMVIDKHFKCVDHVINVCVQRALDDPIVAIAVQKCKDLASATHRSTSKTEKLKKTASENGGNELKFNAFNAFCSYFIIRTCLVSI